MGHKVFYLVVVGDFDPIVFAIELALVQLARKGGDIHLWSFTPWSKEVGFDGQLLLGGDNIPRADLGNQCLDRLIFVSYVFLLEFLDVLRVDGGGNCFDCH